ncbi:hypothetical protein BJ741DRAFT_601867 [Chytriomyces cf. hyalinus JEL632]|nr:hypothetical protein BJ741DRAFT_601867 [Chytriomyces cf. hyalinus JEL632]
MIRSLLLSTSARTTRSFYTWNVPTDTARVTLDDGSILIRRTKEALPTHVEVDPVLALPPRLRSFPKRTPLSPEQVAECIKLRTEDPDTWTVNALCKRYNTYPGRVLELTSRSMKSSDRKQMLAAQEQKRFDALPISKKVTIVDRIRRKALW